MCVQYNFDWQKVYIYIDINLYINGASNVRGKQFRFSNGKALRNLIHLSVPN